MADPEVELKDLDPNKGNDDEDEGDDNEETNPDDNLLDDDEDNDSDDDDDEPDPNLDTSAFVSGFNPEPETLAKRLKLEKYDLISEYIRDVLKLGNVRYDETSEESKNFFAKTEIDHNISTGKSNGIKYNTFKVYVSRKGEIVEATRSGEGAEAKNLRAALAEFKQKVKTLSDEYKKTDLGGVDEAAGVFIEREAAVSMLQHTETELEQEKQDELIELQPLLENVEDGVRNVFVERLTRDTARREIDKDGSKEDITRQIITALSEGVVNVDVLSSLTPKERKAFVEDKLKTLVGPQTGDPRDTSEQQQWRKLASDEREKAREIDTQLANPNTNEETQKLEDKRREHVKNSQLYDKVADLCDLRADEIRIQVGLKPQSDRVLKILERNVNEHPKTWYAKAKQWVKNNKVYFAYGILFVLSIITGVATTIYEFVKNSAISTKDTAIATYKVLKKAAKDIANLPGFITNGLKHLGSIMYTVLAILAKILGFVANNMWILIVFVVYYVFKLAYDFIRE